MFDDVLDFLSCEIIPVINFQVYKLEYKAAGIKYLEAQQVSLNPSCECIVINIFTAPYQAVSIYSKSNMDHYHFPRIF